MKSSKNKPSEAWRPLRVCYFGTYRAEYSRNQIMIESLRRVGVEVQECHVTLWQGIEDRVQATQGGWMKPAFLLRVIAAYAKLFFRYLKTRPYDVMVVGYPGQFDVFLAYLLTRLSRKPLVWDIFMSIYLVAVERGLDKKSPRTVNMLRKIEKTACSLPDRLILDTSEYVNWFGQTHGIAADRFRLVPTGADDRVYHPVHKPRSADGKFHVVYYGTFIPNHGVPFMIEAARCLHFEKDICFEFIGKGPEREATQNLVRMDNLDNVKFIDWMEPEQLIQHLAQADVCLGAFGHTPQSLMTVQNKIYQGLAMALPMVTGDSPAIRAQFQNGVNLIACNRDDPRDLANCLHELFHQPDLRARLGENGYRLFQEEYTVTRLGAIFHRHLVTLPAKH